MLTRLQVQVSYFVYHLFEAKANVHLSYTGKIFENP
jgi:hypothetical protein